MDDSNILRNTPKRRVVDQVRLRSLALGYSVTGQVGGTLPDEASEEANKVRRATSRTSHHPQASKVRKHFGEQPLLGDVAQRYKTGGHDIHRSKR